MSFIEGVALAAFIVMLVVAVYICFLMKKFVHSHDDDVIVDEHNPFDDDVGIESEEFDGYEINFWRAQMLETHKDPSVTFNCDCCGRGFSRDNVDDEYTREIVYSLTCKNDTQTVTKRARFHLCMHCYWYHFLRRTDKIMEQLVTKALRFGSREV